jgi:putative transposase
MLKDEDVKKAAILDFLKELCLFLFMACTESPFSTANFLRLKNSKEKVTMLIRKGYKVKLKTTPEIEKQFSIFSDCCRFVWNKALEMCLDRLKNKHRIPWYHELCFWLTFWKKSDEYGFIRICSSRILQQKLRDLEKAFRDCFDKKQPKKRLPRMKKKGSLENFRYCTEFKIDNRRIYLPKIGWVGFFKAQEIVGIPKNVTITKKGNSWFASIQVEQEREIPKHPYPQKQFTIRLGILPFLTTPDNELLDSPSPYLKNLKKLAKLQKKISKKQKFSKNWQKEVSKLSNLHQKIANIRSDFLHKTSTKISKENGIVIIGEHTITKLTKSNNGTLENPGKDVKAKSALNRSILDQGWGEFTRQLDYKLKWQGGEFVKVNSAYSSMTCSKCNCVNNEEKISKMFKCNNCGFIEKRTVNAANNIQAAGNALHSLIT